VATRLTGTIGDFFQRRYLSLQGGKRHADDVAHVTMTYNAIQILLILGDDLSRIDRRAVLKGLAHLQNPDGRFVKHFALCWFELQPTFHRLASRHMKAATNVTCGSCTVPALLALCWGTGAEWTVTRLFNLFLRVR